MNLFAVLVTGLFAGGVSCAAVQGGLLTGLITRQRTTQPSPTRENVADGRGWRSQLGDDLTPVAGFLAGKLVSHTVLGALLGALGGAVELSVGVRTWLQISAGALIIVFGLAQLGVPGLRRIVVEPPISWMRIVRNQARSRAALAPALLGLATVLIPCGVTLSVEALALTSGSALSGAATMAVFVLGTGPLFAVLGYAARKAATAWRGRLALVTGLAVLVMGLYTLNGGLELAGSPLAASRIAGTVGFDDAPADTAAASTTDGRQTVVITATSHAYSPDNVQVKSGVPTTLVVKSDRVQGCIRSLIIRDEQRSSPPPAKPASSWVSCNPDGSTTPAGWVCTPASSPSSERESTMATTTHTFRVEGMHCGSCALLIDDALEDLPGVCDTQTTRKQGKTTVELDLSQNSADDVIAVIAELGYRATSLP